MTCLQIQNQIMAFINDELSTKELEEFILHIQKCPDCREELEVYYALITAMKQLDEDKNLSEDFGVELNEKIEKSQDRIIQVKVAYYRKKGVLLLVILVMGLFFGLQHYFREKEKVNPITNSDFRIRVVYNQDRFMLLKEELKAAITESEKQAQTIKDSKNKAAVNTKPVNSYNEEVTNMNQENSNNEE